MGNCHVARYPQNVLFRFFTALTTSFCGGLATFGGDNEIEDAFYLVLALISPNKWHLMAASLDLGLIKPFLEGQVTLSSVAQERAVPLRTAQRWVSHYRQMGLAGLARKQSRDRHQCRLQPEFSN